MGSHRSSRVHTRSDVVREPIDEATMRRAVSFVRRGGEEAHGISSLRGKNHLLGLLFFLFCQVQNSKLLERGYFFTPHIVLRVDKSQDLPSKKQTLEDT